MQFKKISFFDAIILRHEHENIESVLEKLHESIDGKLMFEEKVFASSELTIELLESILINVEEKTTLNETDNFIITDAADFKSKKTEKTNFQNVQTTPSEITSTSLATGIIAGGSTIINIPSLSTIECSFLVTEANINTFADLKEVRGRQHQSLSNNLIILISGGVGEKINEENKTILAIEKINFVSLLCCDDFGNLSSNKTEFGACSNKTNGYFFGGKSLENRIKTIEKVLFSKTNIISQIGDLSVPISDSISFSIPLLGFNIGGEANSLLSAGASAFCNVYNFATDVKNNNLNLSFFNKMVTKASCGCNELVGFIGCGINIDSFSTKTYIKAFHKITTLTAGIITISENYGNLSGYRINGICWVNSLFCEFVGGYGSNTLKKEEISISNIIEKISFSSDTVVTNFGNLITARNGMGNSNSHGGCLI